MKTIRNLLLFVGTALFLAACGTGGNGGGDGDQNGTLRFALSGVDSAAVEVFRGSDSVFDEVVEDGDTTELAAGDYRVVGDAVAGYETPDAVNVTVVAGQTATATLNYRADSSDNGPGDGNGEEPVTEAGVHVRVFPPEARSGATVSVIDVDGETVATESGSGSVHFELDPADDLRVVVSSSGYTTWTSEYFDLEADETEDFRVTLAADDSVTGNIAADGITFAFSDGAFAYETNTETNPAKDATLVAAQTEEQICVTVNVVDAAGDPVRNAPVSVGLANDFWDAAVAYPGGCDTELTAATSSGLGQLYTDNDGNVTFSLQALNAGLAWQMILSGEREPIKVLVSSVGADDVARTAEFKLFAINMSHLMFGSARGDDVDAYDAAFSQLFLPSGLGNPSFLADTRMGHDFGSVSPIIWNVGDSNAVTIVTGAVRKQPTSSPFAVPNQFDDAEVWTPGHVVYSIDQSALEFVEWAGTCTVAGGGTECIISDGYLGGAVLNPISVDLTDGSFSVDVHATYVAEIDYGGIDYEFDLKDYEFTVEWVRGYLTVDKYVDQHVLTWYGHDTDGSVTLDAANESLITDDVFTSTVHVTVTNDSDSPIYNVAVRDAVPAELGVIESTISGGGTYDVSNHVVTWNYTNTPGLQEIGVDESFTFTFDVYARHKPGYCWDGEGDANFVVQPMYEFDEGADEPNCYPDPYVVTNGLQANSVTASGFFEDDITGPQYVFSYTPDADESDIWVVRPLFQIDKELTNSDDILVEGMSAFFDVSVRQLDRVTREPTRYGPVYALYPWEFNNADTTSGTGHDADSSVARNNPYAHNVEVSDFFDVGLDFTNGTSFSNVDGGNIQIPASSLDKDFEWSPIASLPVGVIAESTLAFSLNLPSFEFDGTYGDFTSIRAHPDANGTVTVVDDDDEVVNEAVPAWQNCVYLNAAQLNQPGVNTEEYAGTWYAAQSLRPWTQDEVTTSDYDELTPAPDLPALEDCDAIAVLPAPPEAFVSLTTNGEHTTHTDGDVVDGTLFDGYGVGDEFFYALTIQSSGAIDADNVVFTATLSNTRVRFYGSALLFTGSAGSWTFEEQVDFTGEAGTVTFGAIELAPGDYARIIIPARAKAIGTVNLDATVNYSNGPDWQALPLSTQEETSVKSNTSALTD